MYCRKNILLLTLLFILLGYSAAHANIDPVDDSVTFDFNAQPVEDILDVVYDTHEKDYSVLNNSVYRNDRIHIFSYTAYDMNQMNTRLKSGNLDLESLNSLYISFGYGLEYRVNKLNKIGYEYLSTFPYDRGQLIRVFWVHIW
ncbi:hypothetical protein RFH42_01390 [Acinetobacter rudis]|uniref:hypothetical protein n=1 Tax=Acinetobacter rudis TaxID=632955 RepID=UPI00280D364D|nr:hypothetical protein [Acinetobacter rudis]MDQ8951617.1 hypothetical protein [Acinetobacter rudis]